MAERKPWWRAFFGARTDFLELLKKQVALTREAVHGLREWAASGEDARLDEVVELEKKSDDMHHEVVKNLFEAFETPLDREDIHDLSRRLDDVVNGTYVTVLKIRALKVRPHEPMERMLASVEDALEHLSRALDALPKDHHAAIEHADAARHTQRTTEEIETEATAALIAAEDVREYMRQREVYIPVLNFGALLSATCEGFTHAVNKLG